jgi:hypothetical protein
LIVGKEPCMTCAGKDGAGVVEGGEPGELSIWLK